MMNETEETKWPNLLKGYFGKKLTDSEAVVWWDELKRPPTEYTPISDLEEEELARVVRWMSNQGHAGEYGDGYQSRKITVNTLRHWVYAYRHSRELAGSACLQCSEGWVSCREGWAVPCNCQIGKRHRRKILNRDGLDWRTEIARWDADIAYALRINEAWKQAVVQTCLMANEARPGSTEFRAAAVDAFAAEGLYYPGTQENETRENEDEKV